MHSTYHSAADRPGKGKQNGGIFAGSAVARLAAQPDVLEIVCTNTVPIAAEKRVPKLTVLSVAPAFAEAMRRINSGDSVSALLAEDNAPDRAVVAF